MKHAGSGRALDARNRAQVFVDGPKLMLGHALEDGPRHDLEEITVTVHGGKTCSIGCAGAWRMDVIEILPSPHDRKEL